MRSISSIKAPILSSQSASLNLIFLALAITFFSDFASNSLTKILPLNYGFLRVGFDLISLFLIFSAWLVMGKVNKNTMIFLLFPAIASAHIAISQILNGFSPDTVISFFVQYRFFILVFVLSQIDFRLTTIYLRRFLKAAILLCFFLSVLQALRIELIYDLTVPYQQDGVSKRISYSYETWDGSAYAIFNNQISMAFFCLAAQIFFQLFDKFFRSLPFIFISFVCILLSDSISALSFSLFFMLLFLRNDFKLFAFPFIFVIILLVLVFTDFNAIYTSIDYSFETRLGILFYLVPSFFAEASIYEVVFGYGKDQQLLLDTITRNSLYPNIFDFSEDIAPLEDVFWVAILYYFGILGLLGHISLLFLCCFASLASRREYLLFTTCLCLTILIGSFANQLFSIKIFSFLFWFSVGMGMNAVNNKVQKAL